MMAKCLPTILPDLTFKESLEITKIHSVAGILNEEGSLVKTRPFRAPHHSISKISLVGGGRVPKPGEISLAHLGVLFLDELPEFNRDTLEAMRGPLEDEKVTISRVYGSLTYPCSFIFMASMNPCPCGYYGATEKQCSCSPMQISKYMNKISGPLLDRIDIQMGISAVRYEKLQSDEKAESSKEIKKRVNQARTIQINRYQDENIYCNAQLGASLISKYCKLEKEQREIMKMAFQKLGLSARAYSRILKVARTIADLDGTVNIGTNHIAEAIQYRSLDRKYWK